MLLKVFLNAVRCPLSAELCIVSSIENNWSRVQQIIEAACRRSGRDSGTIRIVGVTKNVPVESVREALAAGLKEVGENRVQEAKAKWPQIPETILRHMVGHLQTNKAKEAVRLFDVIHSVDSERLARAIDEAAGLSGKTQAVLIEVNVSGEPTKFGVKPGEAGPLLKAIASLKHLRVQGLMAMAPQSGDPQLPRAAFQGLRRLREELRSEGFTGLEHLSMGMSQDYPAAVEEGATMLRIGRAIFA